MASKKLTLSTLKKEHSKIFNKKRGIVLDNGCKVVLDEVFAPTKMQAAFEELAEKVVYVNDSEEIDDRIMLSIWPNYTLFLLIKYFTDIDIPKSFEDQVAWMNCMIDLHYFEAIIDSFEDAEIEKWMDQLKMTGENYTLISQLALEQERNNKTVGDEDGDSEESSTTIQSDTAEDNQST